jgi:hypothetical protein
LHKHVCDNDSDTYYFVSNMIDNLTEYHEAARFEDYYEKVLKNMTTNEIVALYKRY